MESRETKSLVLTLVKILAEDQLKGSLPLEKKKGPALKSFFKSKLTKDEYNLDILANWGDTAEGVFKRKYIDNIKVKYIYNFVIF